jgi:UTP--glucose-1-phosphate uridylyltransferase
MKAVIPVAGLGTRMLPATKAIPKEMLPIVDKPLIQYVVEEAVQAGITEIVLVTHASKNSIENHFDTSFELESTLEKRVKRQLLEEIRNICPPNVKIMHIRQGEAKGLGHAILSAHPCIGDAPFVVLLPDMIIDKYHSCLATDNLAQMIRQFHETNRSQVLLERVPENKVNQYGIADCDKNQLAAGDFSRIKSFIEKPNINEAPSNLAIVGRYVFSQAIWPLLRNTREGHGGEIQLTDAMVGLLAAEAIDGYQIMGKSHDCGNKKGYMRANIEYGLMHDEVATEIEQIFYEKRMLNEQNKPISQEVC